MVKVKTCSNDYFIFASLFTFIPFQVKSKDINRNMTLPNEVKERLEEAINDWLLWVDEIAEAELNFLEKIGIGPKRETLLSYTAGVLDSTVGGFIHGLYDREMTEEEDEETSELMKRKIPEFELKFKEFLREKEHLKAL